MTPCRRRSFFSVSTFLALLAAPLLAAPPNTRPANGLREKTPNVHALVGAKIVVAPGRVIDSGTVVVRDGVITDVGADVEVPADARRWDLAGKTIYPGLTDGFSEIGVQGESGGAPYWNNNVQPERRVAPAYRSDNGLNKQLRSQGITARLVAPAGGIIKGTSAVVSTADQRGDQSILRDDVAQHMRLTASRGRGRGDYPNSPMGAVALARQAMYDADWYTRAWQAYRADHQLPRPERNDALAALAPYLNGSGLVIIDALDEQYFLRADRFAREFGLNIALRGSGREYRRLDAVRDTGRTIIVPLDFPKAPNVATAEAAAGARLQQLMHWDIAPENPARLAKAGATIVLTSDGLSKKSEFLAAVRRAVDRGLPAEAALRAMTVAPAELFGVSDRLGTVEPGKLAHLVVTDGDLFNKKTKVLTTWVDGQRYEVTSQPRIDLRGKWKLALHGGPRLDGRRLRELTVSLGGSPGKLSGTIEIPRDKKSKENKAQKDESKDEKESKESDVDVTDDEDKDEIEDEEKGEEKGEEKTEEDDAQKQDAKTKDAEKIKLQAVSLRDGRLAFRFDGEKLGAEGIVRVSATVSLGKSDKLTWIGQVYWPDGEQSSLEARRIPKADKKAEKDTEAKKDTENEEDASDEADDEKTNESGEMEEEADEPADEQESDKDSDKPKSKDASGDQGKKEDHDKKKDEDKKKEDSKDLPASYEVNYPLGAYGRSSPPEQPKLLALVGATVWTCEKAGVLENATVLIGDGKILAVGQDVEVPKDAKVIDVAGRHITPGLIDCHSHMATDGGINESTQAITAEVRIGDFIDSNDITIYRQLAGGLTAANVLHGSANPIGGQNQVIKLRWGALPEDMKFQEAPPGIKFALGENVKQSNWGDNFRSRYPQTRMGVEQIVRDEFNTAREYRQQQQAWQKNHEGLPPRRDLELDAIAEVLEGKRWIHCHSYRQDEILALLRTLESFNIQIGTLQHILEGYKVADAMAKHGAMGSTFSDWWAYKFEVYDAIPYNGALMHDAGVVVSFNSDDKEMGRHMNQEAAKAVKYGGVPPEEALKFVTLNPAKQLRIDEHVGSLAPGKDADLVVWSGPPLSNFSHCEQTWIDGRKYFDRADQEKLTKQVQEERAHLVQKILKSGQPMREPGETDESEFELWPRDDEFCIRHALPGE